jgi:hypothetical protein
MAMACMESTAQQQSEAGHRDAIAAEIADQLPSLVGNARAPAGPIGESPAGAGPELSTSHQLLPETVLIAHYGVDGSAQTHNLDSTQEQITAPTDLDLEQAAADDAFDILTAGNYGCGCVKCSCSGEALDALDACLSSPVSEDDWSHFKCNTAQQQDPDLDCMCKQGNAPDALRRTWPGGPPRCGDLSSNVCEESRGGAGWRTNRSRFPFGTKVCTTVSCTIKTRSRCTSSPSTAGCKVRG